MHGGVFLATAGINTPHALMQLALSVCGGGYCLLQSSYLHIFSPDILA